MLRQSQFDSVLTPVIYHHFDLGMNAVPSMRARLYSVRESQRAEEKGTGMGGVAPEAWDQYRLSGTKGMLRFDQLYTQTYTHVEYPVRFIIEKKLLINDQYDMIGRIARKVGISAEQKMEIDAVSLLNNAFSSTWSDAVALCSAAHPLSPNVVSGTQDNLGSSALSKTAVSETRIAMMRFTDDKGNLLGLMPNELWVPPELEDTAIEITRSLLDPASGNNAVNPNANRFVVVPWARLTDTNNWFMMDSVWRQEVVNWYNRERVEPVVVDEDTTQITYEMKLHYSYGIDDWRFVFGHSVS